MFLRVQWTTAKHWFHNGLAPNRQQAIIWTNTEQIHWRIYAALEGDELLSVDSFQTNFTEIWIETFLSQNVF